MNQRRRQQQWKKNPAVTGTATVFSSPSINDSDDEDAMIIDKILNVAIEASNKACDVIRQHSDGADVVSTKSTGRDLLTLIDQLCEKVIRETIENNFSVGHWILGEESVPPGIDASKQALEDVLNNKDVEWLWIVDPIDGTTNFASGIPLNMVGKGDSTR
jgi:myo-inositol-1(or 4)-monophosphatase